MGNVNSCFQRDKNDYIKYEGRHVYCETCLARISLIKFTSWRIPVAHTFFVLKLVMGFGWLMIRPLVYLEFHLDILGSRP